MVGHLFGEDRRHDGIGPWKLPSPQPTAERTHPVQWQKRGGSGAEKSHRYPTQGRMSGADKKGGGKVIQFTIRTKALEEKRTSSTDKKKACFLYAQGKCTKAHGECPLIHNPTCYYYRTEGKCAKGDQCLFPHRDGKGAHVVRNVDAPAPKAKATPKKGTETSRTRRSSSSPTSPSSRTAR